MIGENEQRNSALGRIKAKRTFWTNVVVYLVVNAFLVAIWALTGGGYFWPAWTILGGGVGMAFAGLMTYLGQRPITEDEVRREMHKSA